MSVAMSMIFCSPQLLCVSDSIRENQSALGVGIDDFDSLPGHRPHHVARLVALPTGDSLRMG